MKIIPILCIITLASQVFCNNTFLLKRVRRIIRGERVTTEHNLSFAVSLQFVKNTPDDQQKVFIHFCGGAYLGNGWIITAAHCVENKRPETIFAEIGNIVTTNETSQKRLLQRVVSKKYNHHTFEDDIALAKLKLTRIEQTLSVIKLITENDDIKEPCSIIGYGAMAFAGKSSNELRVGSIHLVDRYACLGALGKYVAPDVDRHTGMFCAGQNNDADACQGDSGGPMICESKSGLKIVGITSYGMGCGVRGMPGVYTSIQSHLPFIIETVAT